MSKKTDRQKLAELQIESTQRVLYRTAGFLHALAVDLQALSPSRAESCIEFKNCLDEEALRLGELIE